MQQLTIFTFVIWFRGVKPSAQGLCADEDSSGAASIKITKYLTYNIRVCECVSVPMCVHVRLRVCMHACMCACACACACVRASVVSELVYMCLRCTVETP